MVILQNNVDIIDSETCYKNFKNTVNLGMTFDSEAVCYTHLDVYKRHDILSQRIDTLLEYRDNFGHARFDRIWFDVCGTEFSEPLL